MITVDNILYSKIAAGAATTKIIIYKWEFYVNPSSFLEFNIMLDIVAPYLHFMVVHFKTGAIAIILAKSWTTGRNLLPRGKTRLVIPQCPHFPDGAFMSRTLFSGHFPQPWTNMALLNRDSLTVSSNYFMWQDFISVTTNVGSSTGLH